MDIAEITQSVQSYLVHKPVIRAYLFGSFATGSSETDSDVDILVELDHTKPIGLEFVGMWQDLQKLLGRKVDLVTLEGVSPFIRPHVESQKLLIYERGSISPYSKKKYEKS
jgi:predicted nucleotidyltransferase